MSWLNLKWMDNYLKITIRTLIFSLIFINLIGSLFKMLDLEFIKNEYIFGAGLTFLIMGVVMFIDDFFMTRRKKR